MAATTLHFISCPNWDIYPADPHIEKTCQGRHSLTWPDCCLPQFANAPSYSLERHKRNHVHGIKRKWSDAPTPLVLQSPLARQLIHNSGDIFFTNCLLLQVWFALSLLSITFWMLFCLSLWFRRGYVSKWDYTSVRNGFPVWAAVVTSLCGSQALSPQTLYNILRLWNSCLATQD